MNKPIKVEVNIPKRFNDIKQNGILTARMIPKEPRHDKINKMSPSPIRVFAVRMKKAWALSHPLSAQRRLWSDWADAQADLSLRWTHTHFVCFVMSQLKYGYLRMLLCPWARHFTPRKYWLITQEAVPPSRYDWKIVDWDVKPQHKQKTYAIAYTVPCTLSVICKRNYDWISQFYRFFLLIYSWMYCWVFHLSNISV